MVVGKGMKVGIALVAVVVVAFVASQLVLPSLIRSQLVTAIDQSVQAELIQVDVAALPAVRLLLGQADRLKVDVRRANFDGLVVDAFLFDATNLVVDLKALREEEALQVQSADSLQVTASLTEEDLNAYFAQQSGSASLRIALGQEFSELTGDVSVLGRPVEVTVKGHFEVTGKTKVAFVLEDLVVAQTRLPSFIIEPLAGKWAVEFDLAGSPVPLVISGMRVEEKRLFVFGDRPPELPYTSSGIRK